MALSSTTNKLEYVGNNSTTTAYPITFQFFSNEHVQVLVDGIVLGPTQYTLTGANVVTGGSVTTTAAVAATSKVVILRELPYIQGFSYEEGDPLPAKNLEKNFDFVTMLIQQLVEKFQSSSIGGALPTDFYTKAQTDAAITSAVAAAVSAFVNQTANYANGSITTVKLADNSVTTAKLVDGSVTNAKITSIESTKISGGSKDTILQHDGTNYKHVAVGSIGANVAVVTFIESKANGTEAGGPATGGQWTDRTVTKNSDIGSVATMVGNGFRLATGNYMVQLSVPGYNVGTHQARLMKTANTGGAMTSELLGNSVNSNTTSLSVISGVLTVTDPLDVYTIEHWTRDANVLNGFGTAANSGEGEIYTHGWIGQIKN